MQWNLARLLPGECIPGIVHDTVKVIDFSQRVHLPRLHLQKVILLSCEGKKGKSTVEIWSWVTLCNHMYVCERWMQFYSVWKTSVQDTDGFCQSYFMHFRMAKVLTFYILQTKNVKIWPEYWLSWFALYMQLTRSGLIEMRMSGCPPIGGVFTILSQVFCVYEHVAFIIWSLMLHLSSIIAEGLLRDLRSYLVECCPW